MAHCRRRRVQRWEKCRPAHLDQSRVRPRSCPLRRLRRLRHSPHRSHGQFRRLLRSRQGPACLHLKVTWPVSLCPRWWAGRLWARAESRSPFPRSCRCHWIWEERVVNLNPEERRGPGFCALRRCPRCWPLHRLRAEAERHCWRAACPPVPRHRRQKAEEAPRWVGRAPEQRMKRRSVFRSCQTCPQTVVERSRLRPALRLQHSDSHAGCLPLRRRRAEGERHSRRALFPFRSRWPNSRLVAEVRLRWGQKSFPSGCS